MISEKYWEEEKAFTNSLNSENWIFITNKPVSTRIEKSVTSYIYSKRTEWLFNIKKSKLYINKGVQFLIKQKEKRCNMPPEKGYFN